MKSDENLDVNRGTWSKPGRKHTKFHCQCSLELERVEVLASEAEDLLCLPEGSVSCRVGRSEPVAKAKKSLSQPRQAVKIEVRKALAAQMRCLACLPHS